jgi:hypothetical protein
MFVCQSHHQSNSDERIDRTVWSGARSWRCEIIVGRFCRERNVMSAYWLQKQTNKQQCTEIAMPSRKVSILVVVEIWNCEKQNVV